MFLQKSKIKKDVLKKNGIVADVLVKEFVSGASLAELGKKYNRCTDRIRAIIRSSCDKKQFEQYKAQQKENSKTIKLVIFMAYAKGLGRIPHPFEAAAHIAGVSPYYAEFKRIAKADGLKYIGLKPRGRERKHTEEELLNHLRELAARLGHTPSQVEIKQNSKYKISVYLTAFGTVSKAQELAGLPPNDKYNSLDNVKRQRNYITREEIIEDIKRMQIELGCFPNRTQLNEYGKYPLSVYYNRFGGVKKMKELPEFKMMPSAVTE